MHYSDTVHELPYAKITCYFQGRYSYGSMITGLISYYSDDNILAVMIMALPSHPPIYQSSLLSTPTPSLQSLWNTSYPSSPKTYVI